MVLEVEMSELLRMIENSNNIVFFGGAGVSTESGIPDFRSSKGLYSKSPEYLLSRTYFDSNPKEFYEFYKKNLIYPDVKPSKIHYYLSKLEKESKLKAIITQNIDGLHQMAGSKKVIELHGSVYKNYCMKCGKKYDVEIILCSKDIPRCSKCGGIIKPKVTLYEESLENQKIEEAIKFIEEADLLIVGGTSLVVYPAAGLLEYYRGDKLVLINKDKTPYDRKANLVINQSLEEAFQLK